MTNTELTVAEEQRVQLPVQAVHASDEVIEKPSSQVVQTDPEEHTLQSLEQAAQVPSPSFQKPSTVAHVVQASAAVHTAQVASQLSHAPVSSIKSSLAHVRQSVAAVPSQEVQFPPQSVHVVAPESKYLVETHERQFAAKAALHVRQEASQSVQEVILSTSSAKVSDPQVSQEESAVHTSQPAKLQVTQMVPLKKNSVLQRVH